MADKPRSFQEIILRLQTYWAEKGCAVLQPYDMEVGAGTFHPATTLRSLGDRAWAAAYVQPSRRPTDGRYGENPNRLQHYYQYQVALVTADVCAGLYTQPVMSGSASARRRSRKSARVARSIKKRANTLCLG